MQWQDFFYVCPGHLKDRGFCTPVVDEAEAEAKRKKEAMEREIELIKQEYEDKMKKKKKSKVRDEKAKDEDKSKEKAKDEEGKDDDDEKAKKEKDDKVVYPYIESVISTAKFSSRSKLSQMKKHHQLLMTYHGSTHFRSTLALCFNAAYDQLLRALDLT